MPGSPAALTSITLFAVARFPLLSVLVPPPVTQISPLITVFTLGDWQTNCHVVTSGNPGSKNCWIVDCGFDPDEMLDFIATDNLKPQAILLTHAHLDHIGGVDRILARFGKMPTHIHEGEAGYCSDPMLNLSAMIGMDTTCAEPDGLLKHGDTLTLDGTTWRVLHTPGHSPGGACFVHDESRQAVVGDTLFAGSIGRFDFPTSNRDLLKKSLNLLMTLPDDMTIYPGHGPTTTIGAERRSNPYINGGF